MRLTVFILTIALAAASALGQTTRPADSSSNSVPLGWQKEVSSIAAAAASRDAQTLQNLIGPDCQVRQFNADHDQDLGDFIDFAVADSVLGNHAYVFPAINAAADIAGDINSSPNITDFLKKQLALADKGGQSFVMQWLTVSLGVQDGQLIGVIVLWDERPDTQDQHRPNFILLKGDKSDNGYAITQIAYGDPVGE